ncbi:MAG: cytochrome c [Bryobacteraceae bacterium]|nr:cytochrome c [Acidobacteriota bacterium]
MQTQKTKSCDRPFFASAYRLFVVAAFTASTFSSPALAAGEDTYKAKCAVCHGKDGSGATPMGKKFKLRDLRSADVQKQSDDDLQKVIAKSKPPMPTFEKTLGAAKIQELVAYIRSIRN